MSNFTATGTFVPIAFALAATKAPVTLIEQSRWLGAQASWMYEVRYHDGQEVSSAELIVGAAQLAAACDPGDFVSSMIVALLHEVNFPDQALIEAQSLADFVQNGGTFGAELVGGFHDGRTFTELPLDEEFFPPPEVRAPLPKSWTISDDGIPDDDLDSVIYWRDRLDPDRRVWLYRLRATA